MSWARFPMVPGETMQALIPAAMLLRQSLKWALSENLLVSRNDPGLGSLFHFFSSLSRSISAHLPPCFLCSNKMEKKIKQHPATHGYEGPWVLSLLRKVGFETLPCRDGEINEGDGHGTDPLICVRSCSSLDLWDHSPESGGSVSTSWLALPRVTIREATASLLEL